MDLHAWIETLYHQLVFAAKNEPEALAVLTAAVADLVDAGECITLYGLDAFAAAVDRTTADLAAQLVLAGMSA
jgi:hypothetical protein